MVNENDKLLTTEQAAQYLGIKPQTLSVWLYSKRYKLKSIKVGRLRRFRLGDLREFLNSRSSYNTDDVIIEPANKPTIELVKKDPDIFQERQSLLKKLKTP